MVAVTVTVGKLDASLALLLTEDHHLIEFPSLLLPKGAKAGSVVRISCDCDINTENKEKEKFNKIEEEIYELYGKRSPSAPVLHIKNATQTSIVLEWDPLELATAELYTLTLYRNGQRLGDIPSPLTTHSTKISGLSVDTLYTFHLNMTTSAGEYSSERINGHTHKMTDLSGITVCIGILSSKAERDEIEKIIKRIGAKNIQNSVKLDTTHFVCTEGKGDQWEKAVEMNIPVVRPEWLKACEYERRIVGVRAYYLSATPPPLPSVQSNTQGVANTQGVSKDPSREANKEITNEATESKANKHMVDINSIREVHSRRVATPSDDAQRILAATDSSEPPKEAENKPTRVLSSSSIESSLRVRPASLILSEEDAKDIVNSANTDSIKELDNESKNITTKDITTEDITTKEITTENTTSEKTEDTKFDDKQDDKDENIEEEKEKEKEKENKSKNSKNKKNKNKNKNNKNKNNTDKNQDGNIEGSVDISKEEISKKEVESKIGEDGDSDLTEVKL